MARPEGKRSERRTYEKPKVTRRRRLADTTEGDVIFVTGHTID